MASPEQGKAKPVTIIHFPKVGKKPPRRPTVSITDMKAVGRDEDATDPHVVVTPEPRVTVKVSKVAMSPAQLGGAADPKAQRGAPPPAKGSAPAAGRGGVERKALPEAHVGHVDVKKSHTPQETAELAAFGHKLFEMGKPDEARVIFEQLVAADQRDPFVHTMLGTIYLALNDQERALALFQAALKLDPDDLAAVVYRGEIRLNRGKVKLAMEDLQRAVTLAPASDPFVERAKRLIKMARGLGKKKK
ncbi:MAG: tetratricopeptide repeat protein [Archangiaceae bacterium]|nr:tetratricopeptide repeat protein [Archangiaceae bacterium]